MVTVLAYRFDRLGDVDSPPGVGNSWAFDAVGDACTSTARRAR
jgi:hypothetical protein